ncbi:T9SS type A sorting domain-containing protein [Tamlana crocina]
MNSKFLFFFLLSLNFAFSQDLYVADNSYLFANDVVVFVNDDIRLETPTSNLYFRGDAQLIQNNDIKNSDTGSLSIYQNQTTGIYEYNYWCSPVGLGTDGTTHANADFLGGNNIYDPIDDADVTNVNSSLYGFTSDYNGTATQLSNYWIYTLKDAEGYWNWQQVFDTGTIETGYGFTLKGSPTLNNVLDFRGRPNNGTITVSCSYDGTDNQPSGLLNHAQTLTGNPYPSALDLKLFLAHADNQTNLNGEIYFWEQKQKSSHYLADYEGGYGVYTPGNLGDLNDNGTYTATLFESYNGDGSDNNTTTGSTTDFNANHSRRYAAIGQGFVIASNVNGGFATFDNSMRIGFAEDSDPNGDGSVFAKGKNKKTEPEGKKHPISHNGVDYKAIFENPTVVPEIRLHTHINNSYYKENVIAFRESTPNNSTYNKFFDGRNINNLATDVYLISGNEKLVVKSIKYDESVSLPLGFKAGKNNSLFSLKIHKLKNVPEHVNVYVYDHENNSYTDVKNGSFEIILNQGTHNDRFEITFSKNALNLPVIAENNFKVFFNKSASEITILNPNQIKLKAITLFDISGKKIVTSKHLHSERKHSISTKSLNTSAYLVNIETSDNHSLTKKVIVHDIAE